MKRASRRWLRGWMLASVVLLLVGLMLPGTAVSWFYDPHHALGRLLKEIDPRTILVSRWFHVLMFAWLAVGAWSLFPRLRAWQVAGILLALGLAGELVQLAVPGRTASVGDLMYDLAGIVLGVAVVTLARTWRNAIRRPGPLDGQGGS